MKAVMDKPLEIYPFLVHANKRVCEKAQSLSSEVFSSDLRNSLHSYDPAREIQIKLREYICSILKSDSEDTKIRNGARF